VLELHLAGAYGIQEILDYNLARKKTLWNFPRFFPFRERLPEFGLRQAGKSRHAEGSVLLVLNLNERVWGEIEGVLPEYSRTVLVQMEAYLGWETAYHHAHRFDRFASFDPSYAHLPGYVQLHLPYDPRLPSSHRDRRGLAALKLQWRHSKRALIDLSTWWARPRKKKAALISTLNKGDRYRIRLEVARRWPHHVDVYGGGWPKDLPNYRGLSVSKLATLRRYSHAIVFENQRQPGYITEKLLDCLVAGTVPVYWGAPDVGEEVPAEALIEFENEDVPIGDIVKDTSDCHRRRALIRRVGHEVLHAYRPERFFQAVERAVRGRNNTE
jgi:hypothetical protein